MILEIIDLGLLVVAQIGQAQCPAGAEVPVDGCHLAECGGRDECGGHDVVVVVALGKYLVVRLSVVGAEHYSDQRQHQPVADREWLTGYRKVVSGLGAGHDVDGCAGLGGIVAASHVVHKSQVGICGGAQLQAHVLDGAQVVVSPPI